ncbi:MAG: hypothetical protein IT291_09920 [Deltaproteobacteria bacterium]|nr:hypothetical protein [Deltaproteobacteria bacterium]
MREQHNTGNSHRSLGQVSTTIIFACLLVVAAVCSLSSRNALAASKASETAKRERPPLYLPEARYVKLVTLGFNNMASDLLWFNTINYFGKQYRGNKDYRWLAHMCDLVTSLNVQATHAVEFCATLLSWVVKEPERSNELLTRAIMHHEHLWRLHYLKGFNYWYFLEQKDKAKEEFTIASKLPDAPPFLASLASRLMVMVDSPDAAIAFLNDLIENTEDKVAKEALTEKLNLAIISRDIKFLETAKKRFEEREKKRLETLEELVTANIITRVPTEPLTGEYYIDETTGEILSSSSRKGLTFAGKTAKTGAFQNEFSSALSE